MCVGLTFPVKSENVAVRASPNLYAKASSSYNRYTNPNHNPNLNIVILN